MNEQELRLLVREAIARQAATPSGLPQRASAPPSREHPSHGLFSIQDGASSGGPCIIEPAVPCNGCGYCKSYGH